MRTIVFALTVPLLLGACEQQKQPQQKQQSPAKTRAPFAYANVPTMPKAADGADGSGCLADSGPLRDGIWFGYAQGWNAKGVALDPACFFSGAEAAKVAAARNDESPPPNDFYIVNDRTVARIIPVAPNATALRVTHDKDGGIANQNISYAAMIADPGSYSMCPGNTCPVWVAVNGGVATEVSMQYLP